jgi:hypothetical protein
MSQNQKKRVCGGYLDWSPVQLATLGSQRTRGDGHLMAEESKMDREVLD